MNNLLKSLLISGCVKLKTAFLIYKSLCRNSFHHTNPFTFSSTYAFCKLGTIPWPFLNVLFSWNILLKRVLTLAAHIWKAFTAFINQQF